MDRGKRELEAGAKALRYDLIEHIVNMPNNLIPELYAFVMLKNGNMATRDDDRADDDRTVGRKRKINLSDLVASGMLGKGETLYFCDSGGRKVDGYVATVEVGNKLRYKNRIDGLHNITVAVSEDSGRYIGRASLHWLRESGESLKDLWDQYLEP